MGRGRRSASAAAPAPPSRWWGEAGAFVAEQLGSCGEESDPVTRAQAVEWAVVGAVGDALCHRDLAGARQLVSAWREATAEHQWEIAAAGGPPVPVERVSDADLERQARDLTAARELSHPPSHDLLRRFGTLGRSVELARLAAERIAGDAGERAVAVAMGERRGASRLRAETFEDLQACARAALRVPEAYPIAEGSGDGQEIVVTVPEHVAHEALGRAAEEGWAADLRLMLAPAAAGGAGSESDLFAHLRVAVTSPRGPLAVSARVYLERTRRTSVEALRVTARERLTLLGWQRGRPPAVERGSYHARLRLDADALGPLPARAAEDLIGHDTCQHRQARWDADRIPDALVLCCEGCRRERIAIVPAHRLPEQHPLALSAARRERAYMKRERARAALEGTRCDAQTIAQLRARDGIASLDPRAHRRMIRTPGRAQSMRGAFSR